MSSVITKEELAKFRKQLKDFKADMESITLLLDNELRKPTPTKAVMQMLVDEIKEVIK